MISSGINFERYYDESVDVPTVYSGAWYDTYTNATCDNFEGLVDRTTSVMVYGETDTLDTDFTVKMIDDHPPNPEFEDGFALN